MRPTAKCDAAFASPWKYTTKPWRGMIVELFWIAVTTPSATWTCGPPFSPVRSPQTGVKIVIQNSSTIIPRHGFVVYFHGEAKAASHFAVGRIARYRLVRTDGEPLGDFADAREAIGAGPRLVTDGRITVDPAAEGFRDPKILYLSAARSAVGLTRDGTTMILATSGGTIREMAAVMLGLGAYQAMALDGGASSGLWLRGTYVTPPGRPLSNALLVLPK